MKLLKKGAEGDLFLSTWNNKQAILKSRKKKDYRNSQLDDKIRRQRTIREAEILVLVKSFGISTPVVFQLNIKNCEILMQKISGRLVRNLPDFEFIKNCKEIGKIVGLLHKNGIMHGDLTTSNFILTKKTIFTIDFGLALRTHKPEDHAVDLRLLKEILSSEHAKIMNKAWESFLNGYKSTVGLVYFNKIINLVSIIESRGRYANVV